MGGRYPKVYPRNYGNPGGVYNFDFSEDDGNWGLVDAVIQGGVLDITANRGYGQRSPDANWFAGANDDFILEFDFKQDTLEAFGETTDIYIKLNGDATPVNFYIFGNPEYKMFIYHGGDKAEQPYTPDTNWHTAKIRRVGTTYYFSIGGGAEISWNYGTARAIEWIKLSMSWCTGDYDNFKYSWVAIIHEISAVINGVSTITGSLSVKRNISAVVSGVSAISASISVDRNISAVISGVSQIEAILNKYKYISADINAVSMIEVALRKYSLTPYPISLQDKNLIRLWVYSTITGDILKAKFGENERMQYEPDWTVMYLADQEPPAADPIWVLTGVDYASVAEGILTINKAASNECSYKREDVGHNTKGNTLTTRMKCSNAAKTTHISLHDGIAKVVLAIYSNKIEDWNDAANSYAVDMTKYKELWLTMRGNFWMLYVDGVFALCGITQTTSDKWFKFGMDGSANLGVSYWDYIFYYNLSFLRNKRIEKVIKIDEADTWEETILDLNNYPIATRDAIQYIQFEVLTDSAFTFYIDWIRSNFELTSAYYRNRTIPIKILGDVLAYQDYEWKINKDKKVEFFEVDRGLIDYICPIKNLFLEEDSVSYFNKIFLVYYDEMKQRHEIQLIDEDSKIPFDKEHVISLSGISDTGAKAVGEAQFSFHKKPKYQLSCSVEDFVFDKNGGKVSPIEIEPNNNVKFLGIPDLPIFRIIKTDYSNGICRLTLETEEVSTPNIMKSIIEMI